MIARPARETREVFSLRTPDELADKIGNVRNLVGVDLVECVLLGMRQRGNTLGIKAGDGNRTHGGAHDCGDIGGHVRLHVTRKGDVQVLGRVG